MQSYVNWQQDPNPKNLGAVLHELGPIITQEVHRYAGPKPLLRARARVLAVDAIRNYDPQRGVPLGAYIRQQLQPLSRYSANLRPVSVSEALVQRAAELNTQRQNLAHELNRDPTDEELADYTGLSVAKIQKYRKQVPPVTAESALVNKEGEQFMPDTQISAHVSEAADAVYADLDERDRQIYDWRVKDGLPGTEIAKRLGVSQVTISQRTEAIADRIQRANRHVMG